MAQKPQLKFEPYRYSCRTLIGNWLEDVCLMQKKSENFSNRMSSNDSVVQKTESMFEYYLGKVPLQAPCDYIQYGSVIQLVAPDFPNPSHDKYVGLQMAVSTHLDANNIRRIQKLSSECLLSVAPSIRPCRRNTFVVRNIGSKDKTGQNLLYGEPFHLQLIDPDIDGMNLVLYSSMKLMNLQNVRTSPHNYYKHGEINQSVGVCCMPIQNEHQKDIICLHDLIPLHMMWRCQHWVPLKRFEAEGEPVKANERLVIAHAANNKLLAAESKLSDNYFGQECGLSLATYEDGHKMPTNQNIFMLRTAEKLDEE